MSSTRYNLNFSEVSRPLVAKLNSQGFDIRDILNAGVLAFFRLTSDEQKNIIAEVNAKPAKELESHLATLRDVLKDIVRKTKEQQGAPSEIIKISPSDQRLWDELQAILDTKKKPIKKPKTG